MKVRKNRIILFISNFLYMFIFINLSLKYLEIFKMGPASWKEICQYLPLSIFCSLIFATWATWSKVGDSFIEFFENCCKHLTERKENIEK